MQINNLWKLPGRCGKIQQKEQVTVGSVPSPLYLDLLSERRFNHWRISVQTRKTKGDVPSTKYYR